MVPVPGPPERSWSAGGTSDVDTSPTVSPAGSPATSAATREVTGEYAAPEQPAWYAVEEKPPATGLPPAAVLLVLAIIAAVAAVVGVASTLIEITTPPAQPRSTSASGRSTTSAPTTPSPRLLAAGTMVRRRARLVLRLPVGRRAGRWAGAALAGWAALLIGLAELPINTAEAGAQLAPADITRDVGFWAVVGAGGVGVLVLLVSFARAGNDRRAGLDPWVAALAAVSALVAAVGPTIPEGSAEWSGNYSSAGFGGRPADGLLRRPPRPARTAGVLRRRRLPARASLRPRARRGRRRLGRLDGGDGGDRAHRLPDRSRLHGIPVRRD